MWRYIIVPMMWSAAIYFAILIGGYFLIVPPLQRWMSQSLNDTFAATIGNTLYVVLWILLSGTIFLSIAGVMSSLFWDGLSKKVEQKVYGTAPEHKHPTPDLIADSIQRMIFSIFIAGFTLCVGWCFFGIPGVLLASWLGLYDYTACAFLRRGFLFTSQAREAFRCKAWFSFALGSGLLTLIPILNIFMLPALVAGGTILCAESFRDGKHSV